MSLNDHYLCIVPEKRLQDISLQHIFLPFEDDEMLSLILSKISSRFSPAKKKRDSFFASLKTAPWENF